MSGVQGSAFFLKKLSLSTKIMANLVANLARKNECPFVLIQHQIVMSNKCYLYGYKLYYELRISRQIDCQIRDNPKKRNLQNKRICD
jgi:hypothetical protein